MSTSTEARFRRRPRETREGWEVLLDGEWRDLNDVGSPAIDARWEQLLKDPSERKAAESAYPRGVALQLAWPVTAPHRCIACGSPSWVDPSDQVPPADICHDADHGRSEETP